jgi:hypothetical protein
MEAFIWMEALGCGEILPPSLNSYAKHHKLPLHVFVYEKDLSYIPKHELLIPVVIANDSNRSDFSGYLQLTEEQLINAYQLGHNGTALLWSRIINKSKISHLIHLDADTIFLGDVVSEIVAKLSQGYAVVGTRRLYRNSQAKKNLMNRFLLHFRRDAVNTHYFGFNKDLISISPSMMQGSINGQGRNKVSQRLLPVIDFFDRITFNLARNGGIYYLDSDSQGKHSFHTRDGEIESKMISFAAVGSGCSFYKNPLAESSPTYKTFALASFSLYSYWLLDTQLEIEPLEDPSLTEKLARLDKNNWTLDS